LSGANTYTGATVFNGGTLQAGAANVFSASSATTINTGGTLDLGGFAQTIDTVSLAGGTLQNGSLAGAVTSSGGTVNGINGAASLTTTGGTTIVTGTNTYNGATTVNGGVLDVVGRITNSSAVNVNAGGTLTGIGSVDPIASGPVSINNGGTLAPGNGTPGTALTISSSLAFQSGALYVVQLNPATASFASVTRFATLGGATVNAVFANGSYVAKQYTILTATDGVSGTFGPLVNTDLSPNFKTALSYDANDVFLNLSLAFIPPPGSGLSGNQQAVSNAIINFFNTNGSIPLVFGSLKPAGLTQLSGETAVGSQQTTFNAMGQFMGLLTDPFMNRGGGFNVTPGANGFAEEESQASAYAAKSNPKRGVCVHEGAAFESLRSALERMGVRLRRVAIDQRQRRARIEQTRPAISQAPPSAPTICSRRTRSPVSRWPAAPPASRSPMAARGGPTCSRWVPMCATPRVPLMSPPRSPMAGRTSPPTAP
jgi:autotransporter-associated beta strand protein